MAFTVPQFPLECALYTGPWLTKIFRENIPGNLALGRRGISFPDYESGESQAFTGPNYLLVPAGTDIRDMSQGGPDQDIIEVPADSGRWYSVSLVDDIGKGFDNEHRYALINKIYEGVSEILYPGLLWPTPMP
jgi:hypothetical protein